jgi:hypothetical protein
MAIISGKASRLTAYSPATQATSRFWGQGVFHVASVSRGPADSFEKPLEINGNFCSALRDETGISAGSILHKYLILLGEKW